MRCLSDEQIEQLASSAIAPNDRLMAHLERCLNCRKRLEQARRDAALVAEIIEFSQARGTVKPLVDQLHDRLPD